MIPKPTRLTRIVRKIMRSGRGTTVPAILQSRAGYTLSVPLETIPARAVGRHVIAAAILTIVAVGARPGAQAPPGGAAAHTPTVRPEILGTRGIVAAGRHYSV